MCTLPNPLFLQQPIAAMHKNDQKMMIFQLFMLYKKQSLVLP